MLQENLIMLRSLAGKTQEDIAEIIGISRQAYAKWERGETIPDIEKCGRLVVLGDDNEGIALVKAEQFEEKLSMAMSVLSKDIKE